MVDLTILFTVARVGWGSWGLGELGAGDEGATIVQKKLHVYNDCHRLFG